MEPTMLGELLDAFYESSGLACAVFDESLQPIYTYRGWGEVAKQEYLKYSLWDFQLQKRDAQHPLVLMFEPGLFVGIAELDEGRYLITAPVGPFEKRRQELLEFCAPAIPADQIVPFCDFMVKAPLFSLRKFNAAFSLVIYLSCGRHILPQDIMLLNSTARHAPDAQEAAALFTAREQMLYHTDIAFEDAICAAIEAGDDTQLEQRISAPMRGDIGAMSADPLMRAKFGFVAFATLCTRAAIRGGLPQETAYSMSDAYCQQMERMFSANDIDVFSYKMAQEFCKRVQDLRQIKRYSPVVQQCVDYIDNHLHEPLHLQDLATACNLCKRSVSVRFKAETGQTVADYIAAQRLREAKYLLSHTDHSLAEISACLQYNSQSYFTQCFRKAYGMTPQRYREGER